MDLKAALGDQYRDGMTAEEMIAAAENINFIDPSTLPPSVTKDRFDKTASELAALKKKERERMTDDEQKAAQQQELMDKIAALEKDNLRMKQKETFMAGGYDAATASKLAECFASGDMDGFVKEQNRFAAAQKEALSASIKADLMKDFVPPGNGSGDPADKQETDAEKFTRKLLSENSARSNAEDVLKNFM